MSYTFLIVLALACSTLGFQVARKRALAYRGRSMHSRAVHHGALVALWSALPALLVLLVWSAIEPALIEARVTQALQTSFPGDEQALRLAMVAVDRAIDDPAQMASADPAIVRAAELHQELRRTGSLLRTLVLVVVLTASLILVFRRLRPRLRARTEVERILEWLLAGCSTIAILTTIGIILSVLFEAMRFFDAVPLTEFLFGTSWSPQTAIRADQVGSSGAFGAIPLFTGTLLISAIAMLVAIPIGLSSAIYLAEYANRHVRAFAKPMLEVLAGIPTVVYGFFAALTAAPAIRKAGESLGLDVSSESALAAGLVMGIMIIPFISSLADDVITAVPQSLRDGSAGLGATRSETIRRVILPAALPGIVGGVLLALSRAIGETMIVVMAAGLAANLTANPLESVTTVTVQIVTLLVGDQEFDSPKTLAAFALGLTLFLVTLILNVIALHVVRRYREQYD